MTTDWNQGKTLPLFVQERAVLSTSIVQTEAIQLRIDIEVKERADRGWRNIGIDNTSCYS